MISLRRTGLYKLIETKNNTKILYLDNDVYAWLELKNIGEILAVSRKAHKTDCIFGMGHYYIYDVHDEPFLSDQQHLELEVDRDTYTWQGYLLLSGLPDDNKKRGRIIPTNEIITGNRRYTNRAELYQTLATKGATA